MWLKVRAERKAQGKSQEYMGRVIKASLTTYSKKELGQHSITVEEAKLIAHDLGKTVEELF